MTACATDQLRLALEPAKQRLKLATDRVEGSLRLRNGGDAALPEGARLRATIVRGADAVARLDLLDETWQPRRDGERLSVGLERLAPGSSREIRFAVVGAAAPRDATKAAATDVELRFDVLAPDCSGRFRPVAAAVVAISRPATTFVPTPIGPKPADLGRDAS